MTYGIQAFNSVGDVLFDTERLSQVQITASGTWSGTGSNSQNTLTRATGEMVCLGIPNTTNRRYKIKQVTGGLRNDSGVDVNYVKLSAINEQSPSFANSYGIELFDSSGDLSYSSNYTQGFKIKAIYPPGSLSGLDTTANPSTVWTGSLTNIYFTIGGTGYGTSISDNFGLFVYESSKVKYANSALLGGATYGFVNVDVVQVIEIRN